MHSAGPCDYKTKGCRCNLLTSIISRMHERTHARTAEACTHARMHAPWPRLTFELQARERPCWRSKHRRLGRTSRHHPSLVPPGGRCSSWCRYAWTASCSRGKLQIFVLAKIPKFGHFGQNSFFLWAFWPKFLHNIFYFYQIYQIY